MEPKSQLALGIVFIFFAVSWAFARKENAGLTMFQRLIRLFFSLARCMHGLACAIDGFFVAYRKGKEEYAGVPINEQLYPPKETPIPGGAAWLERWKDAKIDTGHCSN